jgi:hypothetical protein
MSRIPNQKRREKNRDVDFLWSKAPIFDGFLFYLFASLSGKNSWPDCQRTRRQRSVLRVLSSPLEREYRCGKEIEKGKRKMGWIKAFGNGRFNHWTETHLV